MKKTLSEALAVDFCADSLVFLCKRTKCPKGVIQTPQLIILLKYCGRCPNSSGVHTIELCNTNGFVSQNYMQLTQFFKLAFTMKDSSNCKAEYIYIVETFLSKRKNSIACSIFSAYVCHYFAMTKDLYQTNTPRDQFFSDFPPTEGTFPEMRTARQMQNCDNAQKLRNTSAFLLFPVEFKG